MRQNPRHMAGPTLEFNVKNGLLPWGYIRGIRLAGLNRQPQHAGPINEGRACKSSEHGVVIAVHNLQCKQTQPVSTEVREMKLIYELLLAFNRNWRRRLQDGDVERFAHRRSGSDEAGCQPSYGNHVPACVQYRTAPGSCRDETWSGVFH